MGDAERILLYDNSQHRGFGLWLWQFLVIAPSIGLIAGGQPVAGIVWGIVGELLAVALFARRSRFFWDPARRKIVKVWDGLGNGEQEFDLDRLAIRVQTAEDSGVYHAIQLDADESPLFMSHDRRPTLGFSEIREKAAQWARLTGIRVEETTTQKPVARTAEDLQSPLVDRLSKGAPPTAPQPPVGCRIALDSPAPGEAVLDLAPAKETLRLRSGQIEIERRKLLLGGPRKSAFPIAKLYEIDVFFSYRGADAPKGVMLQSPEEWTVVGHGCSADELFWLRDALRALVAAQARRV